jgi:hypothetical protein
MKTRSSKKVQKKASEKRGKNEVDPSFAPVVSAFSEDPVVRLGRMGGSVLTVNGKMFTMLRQGELVVKLPGQRIDELVRLKVGRRHDVGDGVMTYNWFTVEDTGKWVELARESCDFVKRGKG